MTEANKTHAAALRLLADVYEHAEADIKPIMLNVYADTKEELRQAIKSIGGKWKKEVPKGSDTNMFMYLRSDRIPGVSVLIWRDTVCEKVVTYNCQPLLSPEEE